MNWQYPPYPYPPMYMPPNVERQKTLAEQLEEVKNTERAIKEWKKQLTSELDDDKKKDKKKTSGNKGSFTFLETLSILMIFSIPTVLLQIKFLAYVQHVLQ